MTVLTNKWLQLALCSLLFASCQKSVDTTPVGINDGHTGSNTLSSARVAASACFTTSDGFFTTGTGFTYASWTPVPKVLGTGPTIQWEGNFASFVRPVTTSYYVGTVAPQYACSTWAVIKANLVVKNVPANVGVQPAVNPYNVVGYQATNYGSGYYGYVGQTPTPHSLIVVWHDPSSTSDTYNSDPDDADEAYVIQVNSIVGVSTGPTSTVAYEYYKVL